MVKISDFKNVKVGEYIFCLYPKKNSSIYRKSFAFSLCYIFQMQNNNEVKLVTLYGYEVPVYIKDTKNIKVSELNIDNCSFNVLSQKQYDMINKIVLASAIIKK